MKRGKLRNRLQKKALASPIVVGMCWYSPENWARMKETATDADLFEDSFPEWEAMANENLAFIRTACPNTTKVLVDADEFLTWCLIRGKVNNAEIRSEFAANKVQKAL